MWTDIFTDTRGLGAVPNDVCPLGARRVAVADVPRVASVFVWGGAEPTVLALHGWGTDSTTMSSVVAAVGATGEAVACFDAPGHGVSPGAHATLREYAVAISAVLQRFPTIATVVAHSFAGIAAASAVATTPACAVRRLLLLAAPCSLDHVLERWAAEQNLPSAVVDLVRRELQRRDRMPVEYWDFRTLALPDGVDVQVVHDPLDPVVPIGDAHLIADSVSAQVIETAPGVGHHRILACAETRRALRVASAAAPGGGAGHSCRTGGEPAGREGQ